MYNLKLTLPNILLGKVKLEKGLFYSTVNVTTRAMMTFTLTDPAPAKTTTKTQPNLRGCQLTAFKQSEEVSVMKEEICFYLMAQLREQQCKVAKHKETLATE